MTKVSKEESFLEILNSCNAFIHTEVPIQEIKYLYKPFGETTKFDIEKRLGQAISNRECVIVIGDRGCGKSSFVNYTLLVGCNVFPIILSPLLMDPAIVCSSIESFVQNILVQLNVCLNSLNGVDEETRTLARDAIATKVELC